MANKLPSNDKASTKDVTKSESNANAQNNIDNSIDLNSINISNTYLDSKESICELYILFSNKISFL